MLATGNMLITPTTTLPPGYRLLSGHPTVSEYLALRREAGGLTPKGAVQARIAITGSWCACYVVYADLTPLVTDSTSEAKPSTMQNISSNNKCYIPDQQDERRPGEIAVAMTRVIGDGGWYFHIVDVAVLPAHQQKGLGFIMMEHVLQEIRTKAPPGAYVNLIGSVTGQKLYKKFGFVETAPANVGMELILGDPKEEGPTDELYNEAA